MAVGDVIKEALLVVEKVLVKDSEDIEAGEVIYNDGAGFLSAPNTVTAVKLYVALESHVYATEETAGKDHYIRACPIGCINVQKVAGTAIKEGQLVMIGSTSGEVTLYVKGDAPAGGVSTYYTTAIETGIQNAIDEWEIVLGTCAGDASSSATNVDVWAGVK